MSPRRRPVRRRGRAALELTRRYLALLVVAQVFAVGLGVFLVPVAGGMFDKMLPLVTLVLGYYFGLRQE